LKLLRTAKITYDKKNGGVFATFAVHYVQLLKTGFKLGYYPKYLIAISAQLSIIHLKMFQMSIF